MNRGRTRENTKATAAIRCSYYMEKRPGSRYQAAGSFFMGKVLMKFLSKLAVMLLLATLLWSSAVMAAAKGEQPPSAKDKCPVCGMFVAKYPDWTASVTIENGNKLYFDGAKDMFSFLQQPEKYLPDRAKSAITAVTVKDYYSLKNVNGKDAFFVSGSDVKGPMGAELIPFATKKDADEFMKDHRGKRVFRFGEVTNKVLKEL